MADPNSSRGDWLQPTIRAQGLRRYVQTIRERALVVAVATALVSVLALLYVITTDRVYESQADVLVTPVPVGDPLNGLGVIVESGDPSQSTETAAQLIHTPDVAQRALSDLGRPANPDEVQALLDDVEATPVSQSSIVAVTSQAGSPQEAESLANAFANAAIVSRNEALKTRISNLLPQLRAAIESTPQDTFTAQEQRSQIASLAARDADPTLQVVTPAVAPESAAKPRVLLTLIGGIVAGGLLGIGLAFALRILDPRLRREEQLGEQFQLPTLARVPLEPGARSTPLSPTQLSPEAVESYRTMRATLAARAPRDRPFSVLVTGSSPSEGKTTSAISLAMSFALAGSKVILIEADLRRPAIAKTFGIEVDRGVVSVLVENSTLNDALIPAPIVVGNLRLLLSDYTGPGNAAELLSLPVAMRLIDDAKQIADVVIVDSPPLTEVIDALPLAQQADMVVMIARIRRTNLNRLKELGEILADSGVTPTGFAVLGVPPSGDEGGYYYVSGWGAAHQRDGVPAKPSA